MYTSFLNNIILVSLLVTLNSRAIYTTCDEGKESNIAIKAADEAKAAEAAQTQAGQQAAHQVKEQLAEKAAEAAQAAEAALIGKETLVEEEHHEIEATKAICEEESRSKHQLENTLNSANKASAEAKALEKLLATAIQLAQGTTANAAAALTGVQTQLAEKEKLIAAAKHRLDCLNKELSSAEAELQATKDATKKAEGAAGEAAENAARTRKRAQQSQYRK